MKAENQRPRCQCLNQVMAKRVDCTKFAPLNEPVDFKGRPINMCYVHRGLYVNGFAVMVKGVNNDQVFA